MKRILKWIGILIVVFLIGGQAVRPARTNPTVDPDRTMQAHTQMTPQVAAILQRSCSNCHSYKTVWPWYSQVAPASWLVIRDVNEGRGHMNMSDWSQYDAKRASHKLDGICKEVSGGDMPPSYYLIMHSDEKLSDSDKQTLCDWAKAESQRVAGLTKDN